MSTMLRKGKPGAPIERVPRVPASKSMGLAPVDFKEYPLYDINVAPVDFQTLLIWHP